MVRVMTIGRLAAASGVSAGTIRYYEQAGLLNKPPRTASGYRVYSEDTIRRLTVIRNAQRFGFSLREIAGFFRTREAGGRPCQQVRDAGRRVLASLDTQIAELTLKRQRIVDVLASWDRALAVTPVSRRAHLLERLEQ
jgi:MerR family copper efflux transcriptional regulator